MASKKTALQKQRAREAEKQKQLEAERVAQIEINPLAAAERLLFRLQMEADKTAARISSAAGDKALDAALIKAGKAWRVAYAFGHELYRVTGQSRFAIQRPFTARLNEYQQRRRHAIKQGLGPSTMPGADVIEALKQQIEKSQEMPKRVEGENEYQKMLAERGLTETDPDPYVSQTLEPPGPSRE